MKRKILFVVIVSFLLSGIASAESMWGTYKKYPVVRITVNGKPVEVTDVPAILFDNRTMIPIYLLQQAGIYYEWDAENQTVNIITQSNSNVGKSAPTTIQKTYTIDDAVRELGFPGWEYMTIDAKKLVLRLVDVRKIIGEDEYSIQDALRDLGIPDGSIPTLKTLQLAVSLIESMANSK